MSWWIYLIIAVAAFALGLPLGWLFGERSERKCATSSIPKLISDLESNFNNFRNNQSEQLTTLTTASTNFMKIISGTKTRGSIGEELLKAYLKTQMECGLVKQNANLGDNKRVEYAWKLRDGKYLPIDSKCPDILDIFKRMEESPDDPRTQKECRKEIADKVKQRVNEVTKYQNLPKTMRYCVVAVPDTVYDLVPEVVSYAQSKNVYLVSYSLVPLIAFLVASQYDTDLEKGDMKQLGEQVETLLDALERITGKTDTIENAIKMISNANRDILSEIGKAERNAAICAQEKEEHNYQKIGNELPDNR